MRHIELGPSFDLPANGIIKAGLMDRLHDAHAIGQAAQARAEAVITDAQVQAAHIRRHARQSGHEEGFAAFAQAVAHLNSEKDALHRRVTGLVRESLQRFLGKLPKEDLFSVVLASVLKEIPADQGIAILVHPDNIPMLEAAVQAYRARAGAPVPIRCDPGGTMSMDECLIYAGPEVVDAGVPTMVDEMVNALHGSFDLERPDEH